MLRLPIFQLTIRNEKSRAIRPAFLHFVFCFICTSALDYLARFHIKALLLRLAHREGLARQRSVQDDRFEQV